jgi:DNA-binding LacI/PurR family transcriptional regulator
MPPTIKEVADQSGVSTATVSRALRGLPNVAPSTRKRVLRAAKALNYAIDARASRLATGHTMTIGIVMPLADSWFYSKVSTAAEALMIGQGYDVARYSIASRGSQAEVFEWLSTGRHVDGLIVVTMALTEKDVDILVDLDVPVVTIETETGCFASVGIDNVAAAKTATRHLINLGHEQIGVISGLRDDPMRFAVPRHRLEGYQYALREHDIGIRPELDVPGNFSLAGGAEAMIELLSVHQPPTAVFAFSDEMAIGALKAIHDMNLRVPKDVSVVGFDDHDIAEYLGLTTVRQPVAEYGERAASLLLRLLDGAEGETLPHIELSTQLVVRSTTGPPASFGKKTRLKRSAPVC